MPVNGGHSQHGLAADWLRASRSLCVLTGAGVSAECGLATFRGPDGLWKGNDPTRLATPAAFHRDPGAVWEFYNWRREQLRKAQPNPGHFALAALQELLPEVNLLTQNVDRLHQQAGSRNVAELHGNIREVRCTSCAYERNGGADHLGPEPRCPECGDWLRPCVVWFGEQLPREAVALADQWVARCDVFLSVGTSNVVWPASAFAGLAQNRGARVIEVNLEPTPLTQVADLTLLGKAGELLPVLARAVENPPPRG